MTRQEIGNQIRFLRMAKECSRESFAEKIGVSSKFIYEIENGKKGFSSDTLLKIAQELNVSCDCIMGNEVIDTEKQDSKLQTEYRQKIEAVYMKRIIKLVQQMEHEMKK